MSDFVFDARVTTSVVRVVGTESRMNGARAGRRLGPGHIQGTVMCSFTRARSPYCSPTPRPGACAMADAPAARPRTSSSGDRGARGRRPRMCRGQGAAGGGAAAEQRPARREPERPTASVRDTAGGRPRHPGARPRELERPHPDSHTLDTGTHPQSLEHSSVSQSVSDSVSRPPRAHTPRHAPAGRRGALSKRAAKIQKQIILY